ncbi:MAG: hypothetical protein JW987_11570 [Anaerolineaceae bacterium]|nr:hypothetical protein [Anaerolineaceae bacterium]
MRFKNRFSQQFFLIGYVLFVSLTIYSLFSHWVYDDPFITYRYAENIKNGEGFVYNSGQRNLSTTSPLFAIILSVIGRLWDNLPHLAVLIGSVSLALCGLLLYKLAVLYNTPVLGWVGPLLLPTFPLLLTTLSSETPLYLALILGSIYTYERKRYIWTGLLSALVILTRPDGALLPVILAAHYLLFIRKPIPWKAVLVFLLISAIWFGFAWTYFGTPLPVTLVAKQNQGDMVISQRFLPGIVTTFQYYASEWGYRIAATLAILGAAFVFKQRQWFLLLMWTVCYFVAYSLLGVSRYFWYYAPLVPGFIVLVGAGLSVLWNLKSRFADNKRLLLVGIVIAGFAFVATVQIRDTWRAHLNFDKRMPVYAQLGNWLRENTPENASVGALEVGAIGYYSRRVMIDFAGLIQPDVAYQLTSDTTYEDAAIYATEQYHPDYVALSASFPRLRETLLMDACQLVQVFEDVHITVDLYACQWN